MTMGKTKYTRDQLMAMDDKTFDKLYDRAWKMKTILDEEAFSDVRVKLDHWDIKNLGLRGMTCLTVIFAVNKVCKTARYIANKAKK